MTCSVVFRVDFRFLTGDLAVAVRPSPVFLTHIVSASGTMELNCFTAEESIFRKAARILMITNFPGGLSAKLSKRN